MYIIFCYIGHIICYAYPGAKIRNFSDIFTIFASWTNKSTNAIKKALKIFWKTLVVLAVLIMALALLLQTPMVQTYVTNKVMEILSENIDGKVTFEKVHFKPFSNLVIKNLVIIDEKPVTDPKDSTKTPIDTLLRAEYIVADFSFNTLFGNEGIHMDEVTVKNTEMNLVLETDPKTGRQTNNLTRIFRLDQIPKKEKTDKEIFRIHDVKVQNFTFTMNNYTNKMITYYDGGINWNDLHVSDIYADAEDLRFKGGVMSGSLKHLSFVEKSGYICNSISGKARVDNRLTHITDFKLEDPWSVIRMPEGKLIYTGIQDFSDYIHKVVMDAEIGTSLVDFTSISYFAPQLKGNKLRVNTTGGRYYGTVDDFTVTDVTVAMEGGGFSGTVSGRMTGIPDVMNTRLNGELKDCRLTTKGLSRFVTYWMPEGELDLSSLAKHETFRIYGTVDGTLNNMVVQPRITSAIGSISGKDIRIDEILTEAPIKISGQIKTQDLDAGRILGTDLLGRTTLTLDAEAAFGDEEAQTKATVRSLNIDRLHLYGYDYSNISAEAVISERFIDGRLTCNDPNLNFMTHGRYGISQNNKDTKYDFVVLVGDADLNKINIDKRGKSKTRFRLTADFTKTPANDIFGDIVINDLWLENSAGAYSIGDISLNSINRANSTYKMDLSSSFAEGSLTGTAPVTEFINDILGVTIKRELPALFKDPSYEWSGNRYKFDFHFGNTQDILAWALPGMYIADNTTLEANINDRGRLNVAVRSQRIAFNRNYLMDMNLTLNNNENMISGEISGSELKVATMKLSDNSIKFLAEDNHIGVGYRYENNSELENRGEFIIHGNLHRDINGLGMDVKLLPSTVYLNSREWRIRPSFLSLAKDGISDSNVEFASDDQIIRLHGGTSESKADTLNLNLEQFDMSIINPLFKTSLGIRGSVSGNVQLTSPMTDKGILVHLAADSTYFADKEVGRLSVISEWDEAFERFNIMASTEIDGRTAIDARGRLTPKTRNLEAHAKLDEVSIGYLQPLLNGIFSDLNGYVSGEIQADGPIDNLSWESTGTRVRDGSLVVDYTNVPYFVDGSFRFTDSGLFFDDVRGRDRYDGTASITGGIEWNNKFQNIFYDINIKCNEIEGIDLNEKQNEYFYGNVFGSGNVTFRGPSSDMQMNVEGTTAKTGTFHVPISYTSVSGRSNLLKFTEIKVEEPVDPYHIIVEKMEKKTTEESKFTTNMKITALPEVEAVIWIDKASGHMLSGNGTGTIQMMVDDETFDITGEYDINRGNYKFVAYGIVNRDFEIQDGSSISFQGDIFDSTLDIDAMYKTKASIGTLIGDTTSVANRRTVECKIKITDKMLNPRLQFGIEIPEIDPMIKSRVESALSTEDKVQKQFLSLLLSNSFLPDEQSGIVNNSTMLYSNVSQVMASQLNNILEQLNIPVDLGLNYQPNEKGNDVFDVAVSTQMFDNRVVVNGSVGNKQYTENAQTDVVGDLDIEIKLNKSGAFRLNLFSHSADSYTNYLDNSQRNGVGLTYQTEFSSLKQFFKNLFSSKKKRQEAKQAEEEARADEERVTLKIE